MVVYHLPIRTPPSVSSRVGSKSASYLCQFMLTCAITMTHRNNSDVSFHFISPFIRYCDQMKVGDAFTATFRSFSYTPLPPPPGPSPRPSPPPPPGPPAPPPAPAAQCAAAGGILNTKKKYANICCAKSCGTCGKKKCGDKPGGSHNCCSKQIAEDGRKCSALPAPCVTS